MVLVCVLSGHLRSRRTAARPGRLSLKAGSSVTGLEIGSLVALALTYDARNLLSTLSGPGGSSSFTHDPGGRLTQIETPDATTRSLAYDAAGRPTQLQNTTQSGTQTFAYTYDANGNVTSENQTTYAYDALGRLASWYDPGSAVTTTYTYDPAGNLTEVRENGVPTESYTFDAGNCPCTT
jgi:YD repeat-containing protein